MFLRNMDSSVLVWYNYIYKHIGSENIKIYIYIYIKNALY